MSDVDPGQQSPSAEMLRGMAAALGVTMSEERATALATQAEPHFALLRALDAVADPASEPAAEFRLDDWPGSGDG